MRFLFIMLTIVWLLFSWVCFSALRWQPPLPRPWHAEDALSRSDPARIDADIEEITQRLENPTLAEQERAWYCFQRAQCYWLKTYLQNSRLSQLTYLKLSLKDCFSALELVPDHPSYLYAAADLYHQMKDYAEAEKYYQKVLKIRPDYALAYRRYHEMLEEMGQKEDEKKPGND
ncbi:MAG: tetratricopeptide repeat protein [Candidatus Omnitrophota bacterium]